jgi:hypothetical protein
VRLEDVGLTPGAVIGPAGEEAFLAREGLDGLSLT